MRYWMLSLLLISGPVLGAEPTIPAEVTCDFIVTATTYYDGSDKSCTEGKYCEVEGTVNSTLRGISQPMVNDLNRRGLAIIDQASRDQDHGGKYAMDFEQAKKCGGAAERMSGVRVEGVTFAGGNRIARKALEVGAGVVAQEERRRGQGGARMWGKKDKPVKK